VALSAENGAPRNRRMPRLLYQLFTGYLVAEEEEITLLRESFNLAGGLPPFFRTAIEPEEAFTCGGCRLR
jgi:hypothetical protein